MQTEINQSEDAQNIIRNMFECHQNKNTILEIPEQKQQK